MFRVATEDLEPVWVDNNNHCGPNGTMFNPETAVEPPVEGFCWPDCIARCGYLPGVGRMNSALQGFAFYSVRGVAVGMQIMI